jgi:hypothetical protein
MWRNEKEPHASLVRRWVARGGRRTSDVRQSAELISRDYTHEYVAISESKSGYTKVPITPG